MKWTVREREEWHNKNWPKGHVNYVETEATDNSRSLAGLLHKQGFSGLLVGSKFKEMRELFDAPARFWRFQTKVQRKVTNRWSVDLIGWAILESSTGPLCLRCEISAPRTEPSEHMFRCYGPGLREGMRPCWIAPIRFFPQVWPRLWAKSKHITLQNMPSPEKVSEELEELSWSWLRSRTHACVAWDFDLLVNRGSWETAPILNPEPQRRRPFYWYHPPNVGNEDKLRMDVLRVRRILGVRRTDTKRLLYVVVERALEVPYSGGWELYVRRLSKMSDLDICFNRPLAPHGMMNMSQVDVCSMGLPYDEELLECATHKLRTSALKRAL